MTLHSNRSTGLMAILGATVALAMFHAVGTVFLGGFALDLGTLNFPTVRYVVLVAFWAIYGTVTVGFLTIGLSRLLHASRRASQFHTHWVETSDRHFLAWTMTAALAIPSVMRAFVLQGAPLTDDESAYRFTAELLASGRLWTESPAMREFFDQNFAINDGRLRTVYFVGWPALMAPFVRLGVAGWANPVLSALTVPALYGILGRVVERGWARGGVVLFLCTPFIQVAAATQLSHTACLAALAWGVALCFRSIDDGRRTVWVWAFTTAFVVAFFVRPQVTLPLALPVVLWWLLVTWRQGDARTRHLAAFVVPACLGAVLFTAVLWQQNGSPFKIGYARYGEFMRENGFRFTTFGEAELTTVAGFDFSSFVPAVARTAVGLFRLNFDLFGWPSSLLLALLALPRKADRSWLFWTMAGSFLLMHLFQHDWGIDSFGPVHAFELSLPLLVLTVIALQRLSRLSWTDVGSNDAASARPPAAFAAPLLIALVVSAWAGFVPARLEAVRRIASHVNIPLQAPHQAALHDAVVFAPWPFAPPCVDTPGHFVVFRPFNDPDLRNDVLWVNHIDVPSDKRLMATLPGRTGFVMRWREPCGVELVPLDSPEADAIPAGRIRASRNEPK
jgi:hypothetical protein